MVIGTTEWRGLYSAKTGEEVAIARVNISTEGNFFLEAKVIFISYLTFLFLVGFYKTSIHKTCLIIILILYWNNSDASGLDK